ncbi:hypothetical protein HV824_11790 [Myxococcus sp. AM009]|uniref:hypothetical protein n=1 Tax=unclassified Myxococcus TaxID=2648731 RepID=UPI001594F105|nr:MULTISPECIES: hypothetical protein [unclassified Myxococcus]NVI98798.1 hypothetical protein [Myxococcus sp. AM009]NVJ16513.1 hypothetical protein [Myxococcus sp. AM010]
MDGGLAIFGLGLFLLGIANLYVRHSYWLAVPVLLLAVVSMGLAFSESKRLREVSLGVGVALLLLTIVALAVGTSWWLPLATFLFAVAYGVLWAEYRFPFFQHVAPGDVPRHSERRFHVHWPWHRRRVTP